jgi:hypothetical protein
LKIKRGIFIGPHLEVLEDWNFDDIIKNLEKAVWYLFRAVTTSFVILNADALTLQKHAGLEQCDTVFV